MENRFKVVYTGELQPYVSAQEAIRNVASLFKMSDDTVRALVLGGRARDIKVDLDKATAERYASALSRAGLEVRIVPMKTPKLDLRLTPISPAEAAAAARRGELEQCPKCGSPEVQGGVCQACGVVVAKYLGRLAASGASLPTAAEDRVEAGNPYAPPRAELTPEPSPEAPESLDGPHRVPIGHGWGWISRGFRHFKDSPWAWILITVCYVVIGMALSLVPYVGALAAYLVMPVLTGGLMLGAYDQGHGERLGFHHLFAGFSNHTGSLLAVGALYLGGLVLAGILVVLVVLGLAGLNPSLLGQGQEALEAALAQGGVVLAVLFGVLLTVPLLMAYWFAPALVAIDGLRAWPAMKLSFQGCLKNILPFLVYGLAATLLLVLGSLPVFLGLLVVVPTLTASMYASYRDVFYGRV